MQWIDQLTIKKCLILTICISVLSLNPTKTKYYTIGLNPVEEKYPFALQKKIQDIFCLTLWSSLRLISSWYSETGEGLSLSVSRYCPYTGQSTTINSASCLTLGNPDLHPLLLGAQIPPCSSPTSHFYFRCWSCYVCLGQALGLPRATTSPRTRATPPPTPPTTPFSGREASLATMALPQSQGLALATALDLATTSNGGVNSQLLSYWLTSGVLQECWSRSEPFATCNICAKGGRGNPGGDSAEVRTIPTD